MLPPRKPHITFSLLAILLLTFSCVDSQDQDEPEAPNARIFEEVDGLIAVEAEHYHRKSANNSPREWQLISTDEAVAFATTDQASTASSSAYMEGLPDTRVTHDDELIVGTNFFPEPGIGPILEYDVWFNTPGRYLVWARIHSTGTEDNGVHVGINGAWPESGQRIQWCAGKDMWTWSSAQRVPENHCGVAKTIYLDVAEAGSHTIQFSMREDGFEFDKWVMVQDTNMVPQNTGPEERFR